MIITLTQIALIFFLVFNLVVALYATRNVTTMDEYVKANKELGSGALIATLVATLLDAGNIGIKIGYAKGAISLLLPFFYTKYYFCKRSIIFTKTEKMAKLVGYARVSTNDQDVQFQVSALEEAGCAKKLVIDNSPRQGLKLHSLENQSLPVYSYY